MEVLWYLISGGASSAFANTRKCQIVLGFVVEVLHPASKEQATPRALQASSPWTKPDGLQSITVSLVSYLVSDQLLVWIIASIFFSLGLGGVMRLRITKFHRCSVVEGLFRNQTFSASAMFQLKERGRDRAWEKDSPWSLQDNSHSRRASVEVAFELPVLIPTRINH